MIATLAFVPRGVRHVETDGALLLSGDVDNGWPFQRVERLRTRANRRAVDRGFGKMKQRSERTMLLRHGKPTGIL